MREPENRQAHRRSGGAGRRAVSARTDATAIVVHPPTFVDMTDREYRDAIATLAELLLWVWEAKAMTDERPAA